jgi:hypothetical protein
MPKTAENATARVSTYLDSLPEWSQKICACLRKLILAADPSIIEDWKWGPHYSSNGMVCGWGAFGKHVKFTFFNGDAMKDAHGLFNHCVDNEFSRSIKFTDVSEINEKQLTAYIKESVTINKNGYKRQVKDKTVEVPQDLEEALRKIKSAATFFDALSYGYKKDFVQWVTSAKRHETRQDRIKKVVALSAEGKTMNEQYKKQAITK